MCGKLQKVLKFNFLQISYLRLSFVAWAKVFQPLKGETLQVVLKACPFIFKTSHCVPLPQGCCPFEKGLHYCNVSNIRIGKFSLLWKDLILHKKWDVITRKRSGKKPDACKSFKGFLLKLMMLFFSPSIPDFFSQREVLKIIFIEITIRLTFKVGYQDFYVRFAGVFSRKTTGKVMEKEIYVWWFERGTFFGALRLRWWRVHEFILCLDG